MRGRSHPPVKEVHGYLVSTASVNSRPCESVASVEGGGTGHERGTARTIHPEEYRELAGAVHGRCCSCRGVGVVDRDQGNVPEADLARGGDGRGSAIPASFLIQNSSF